MTSADAGTPDPETPEELLAWARAYARTVDLDVDLDAVEWDVSHRARRRAGACRWDPDTGTATVVLTWGAYGEHGWREMAGTVRHELVHAWEFQRFGESDHGARFRETAAAVDAPLRCAAFGDPRYVLRCERADCDWHADRHRAAATVRTPGRYRCGDCGDRYAVEHVASGRTWTDEAGYEAARVALGDDW